jgi:serine/threonine protein kinase/prepilin signal peptidase PulO-like enzyme (type II secretory pathway)
VSLVFGKYEKIRRIAQGGMGEVFLARQIGVLDRLAILKALRPDLAKEKDFVEQFLDEARVAATLNHPNIVAIYDVGDWNGTYYIAMEYIAGEDLSKLWYAAAKAGVGLPFQVSVRIVMEAGLGLDHAHRAKDVRGVPLNIVHRDISPQNIMVRADGVTKLVDFGIAKAANKSSRTQAGMVKGKLQYMSPEQVRGEQLDGRSDQFSLGIVIWEMCTGRRLFKADSEINTLQKILQNPIAKPSQHVPGFPGELENIIMKMLERDPGRRYASLGDVGARLKEYLDRASVQSGEVGVAAFVQQILGKELEERTRDLTPMEPTEVGARPSSTSHAAAAAGNMRGPRPGGGFSEPAKTSSSTGARRPEAAGLPTKSGKQAVDHDPPTAVVAPEERPDRQSLGEDVDGLAELPSGPTGEWVVRKTDGSVVHFQEWATLQQWVLDGKISREDQLSTDGRRFVRLGDDVQLKGFFLTAEQASSGKPRPVRPGAPVAVDPAPSQNTTTANRAAAGGVTVPLGDVVEDRLAEAPENDPTTLSSGLGNDPFASTGGGALTGAFSLGSLPSTQTGQWQIGGPLQQQLADQVAAKAAQVAQGAPANTQAQMQTDPTSMAMSTDPRGRPPARKKVPPAVWALVGILGSFVAIAVVIRVAAPDVFQAIKEGDKPSLNHARAALAATRKDEPATLDAMLQNFAPDLEEGRADVDAEVGAALLHLERWRVLRAAQLMAAADVNATAALAAVDPAPELDLAKKFAARAVARVGDAFTAAEVATALEGLLARGGGRDEVTRVRYGAEHSMENYVAGLLAALAIAAFGPTAAGAGALLLIFALIALTFIDLDTQLLPDDITLPLLWLGLAFNLSGTFVPIADAVAGAMLGYGILWTIFWIFKLVTGKEGMGQGDFKLLAALGAWLGWQALPIIVVASAFVGALVGLTLISLGRHDRAQPMPFGPFLAVAGWLYLIWGQHLRQFLFVMAQP